MEKSREEQVKYFNEHISHAVIVASNLTNNEKVLYLFLLYHFQANKTCYPGYDTLCSETKIGKRGALSLAIKKLTWKKLILVKHSRKMDVPNIYTKMIPGEVARRKLGVAKHVRVDRFEIIPHCIITANALTNDAKILYCILRFHARQKKTCFPGYEVLLKEAQLSRGTLRRCIRQLELAGLISCRKRRDTHQSTIYTLLSLTNMTRQFLKKEDSELLSLIQQEEKRERIERETKEINIREINYQIRRSIKSCVHYVILSLWKTKHVRKEYEHIDYVSQLMQKIVNFLIFHVLKSTQDFILEQSVEVQSDPKKISPTESIYTSSKIIRNNSKILNLENTEKREHKTALEKFKPKLPEALQRQLNALKMKQEKAGMECTEKPDSIAVGLINPQKEKFVLDAVKQREVERVQPEDVYEKLNSLTEAISAAFSDIEHTPENMSHTRNLFQRMRDEKKIDQSQFLDQMVTVKALMKERVGDGKWIKNRMAYFYRMLENRFLPNESTENKHRFTTNKFVEIRTS